MKTNLLFKKHFLGITGCVLLIIFGMAGCARNEDIAIPIPVSTYGFAQCMEDPESFYVLGGRDEWDHPMDHFLRYNTLERVWYRLAPLPEASAGLAAACWHGKLYVVTPERHLFIYDIQDESWSEGTAPGRNAWGAAIGAWEDMLYLVGGAPSEWGVPVNEVNIYHIDTGTWISASAEGIPTAVLLPGYTQAGPYLYVVGGFGDQSPEQNVDATQRFDMSTQTWEIGPNFTSARAAFALSITDNALYAGGGDINGGGYLEETNLVERLDLAGWPQGSWVDAGDTIEPALMYDSGGFCTEALTGGEIWTVGGAQPEDAHLNAVTTNQYGDIGEGCLHGAFGLQASPAAQEGIGFPGDEVRYTLWVTNTGGIPDAYHVELITDWPAEVEPLPVLWSGSIYPLEITVTVSTDVQPGETGKTQVVINSEGDPMQLITATMTTGRYGELFLEPASLTGEGALGDALEYAITLRNATGQEDSFDLQLGDHAWDTTLSVEQIGPLPDGGEEIFTVTVSIPEDIAWYSQDFVAVTAFSQATPWEYADTSQVNTTAYAPAQISISPVSLESTQNPDQIVTQTLNLSNGNGVTLTYSLSDDIPSNVLRLRLDEPVGSTFFQDSSGMGNHGTCQGTYCPLSGIQGYSGTAVHFDGLDDRIQALTLGLPTGNSDRTLAAWVRVDSPAAPTAFIAGYGTFGEWAHAYHIYVDIGGSWRFCFSQWGTAVCGGQVEMGRWSHVAVTNIGSLVTIYVNGVQVGSGMQDMNTAPDTLFYLGRLPGSEGDSRRINGAVDEVIVLDRALSSEEIQQLYVDSARFDHPWLSFDPVWGSIPTDSVLPIQAAFDATDLQPDTYTTTLFVISNDPLNPRLQVPVAMTVEPTTSMGWVEGMVTDVRTGEPLEADIIVQGQPYTFTSDAETGYYKLWLEAGSYTLVASAPGYVIRDASVSIVSQHGVTSDLALLVDSPWLQLSTDALTATLEVDAVITQTLVITNSGSVPLDFSIAANESYPAETVLLMHMDEPTGATTFYDSSGYGNHGTCSGDTCPEAGAPGISRQAIEFDGSDYIVVPNSPELNPQNAISFSAWIYPYDVTVNRRILQKGSSDNQYILGYASGVLQLHLIGVGLLNTTLPTPGAWHHVVGLYDGTKMQIWIDGQLSAETPASGQINVTNEPLYIGTKHVGAPPVDYFIGCMDRMAIFARALTQAEIVTLYQIIDPPTWLSVQPITGTISIASSLPVQVSYHPLDLQPGTYTNTLYINSNDLLQPFLPLPVTMTVEPTPTMGWVEGYITDLRTGEPLEATIIATGQPYTITSDAESGYYKLWLEAGSYTLQVSAGGYVAQSASVDITAHLGVTYDFALTREIPWMEISPEYFVVTQAMDQRTSQTMTITNSGWAPLDFVFTSYDDYIAGTVLYLDLDEAAGSTTFMDSSGFENHGICPVDACPEAGLLGISGNAIEFDGNDYIGIPNSLELNPQNAVTFSAWIYPYDLDGNRRILQKGSWDNQYIFDYASGVFQLSLVGIGYINATLPTPDAWHHMVGIYDGTKMQIWTDGQLSVEQPASGQIAVSDQPLYIGTKYPGAPPCDYFYGMMDEIRILDRALTPSEIVGLYHAVELPPWLTVEPISGSITSHTSFPVQVTFDAIDLQPDTYTTTLNIITNDMFSPLVHVPITMTVTAQDWYGKLEGMVTSPGYCDISPGVLAGTELLIESSSGVTWTVTTDENGHYAYWLDANTSPYTVTASLPGYETVVIDNVGITGQQTTPLDFNLRWLVPCLSVMPISLDEVVYMGYAVTLPVTITNNGGGAAHFTLIERNFGYRELPLGQYTELTIPAAPEAAPPGTAVAAGPYTPRPVQTLLVQKRALLDDAPRVLLLHADDNDGQWIRDQLWAYGDLAVVDAFNARSGTPTLAQLQAYDVVLTWSNYPYQDPAGVGDVLADYVDAGGKVIDLMYALGQHGWEMQGRFVEEGYTAIAGRLVKYETACLGDTIPDHPILLDVTEACEFYRLSDTTLTENSLSIARYTDGELFIAAKTDRPVVSIAAYVGYYYRWSGQMDRVVHNAILWLVNGQDAPWLSVTPGNGDVAPDGGQMVIQVRLDSLGYQPSQFLADLIVHSNDPQTGEISLLVTMNVEPTPTMGWVEGVVTDLRTGEPLSATITAIGQPYTTTSDAETGYYKLWLEQGTYTLQASALGYGNHEFQVQIIAQQGTIQDIALLLAVSWIEISPETMSVTQEIDEITTHSLNIRNAGIEPLTFNIYESGSYGAVMLLHLDEGYGSKLFFDASGSGNHGSCSGNTCPEVGEFGRYGRALEFDGNNDFVKVEHSSSFDTIEEIDVLSVAAWVNIHYLYADRFPIIDKYEADNDFGWVFEVYPNGSVRLASSQSVVQCGFDSHFNEWIHLAVVYSKSVGLIKFYVDGTLACHIAFTESIPDTYGEPLYIGYSPSGSDEYANGKIDEVVIFDRWLTPSEIQTLYEGGPYQDNPWLGIYPTSGTIPPNESLDIQVTFTSTDLLPGIYTDTLYIVSNDPSSPVLEVPVTMTVTSAPIAVSIDGPGAGWVGDSHNFVAMVEPGIVNQPLTYTWQATGQEVVIHTGGITDTVAFTWLTPGTQAITVTVMNEAGGVTGRHLITISQPPSYEYLPLILNHASPNQPRSTARIGEVGGLAALFSWGVGMGLWLRKKMESVR